MQPVSRSNGIAPASTTLDLPDPGGAAIGQAVQESNSHRALPGYFLWKLKNDGDRR